LDASLLINGVNPIAITHQLMAIFDWRSPEQAAVYTRQADRRRLAGSAMHLIDPGQIRNEKSPPSEPV
jgi:hypothetical protein